MIKYNKGTTELKGSLGEITADLTIITKAVYETIAEQRGEDFAKQRIEDAYKRAFMTEEELDREIKERVESILRKIGRII